MTAPTLEFDEAAHRYSVGGQVIPSVTQIIAPLADFSRVDPVVLEAKRQLGTAVHLACHLDDFGELDLDATSEAVVPYVLAWRSYRATVGAEVVLSEQRLYHPDLRFAGTLDRVLRIKGQNYLIDLKTGAVPSASWGVQLAGYQLLLAASQEPIHFRAALILKPDARFEVVLFRNPNDELCFRALLSVHRWKESNQ